jgi:hypothetical protein
MITLKFLGTWLKIAAVTAGVLLVELALLQSFGWFLLAAVPTALVFTALTIAMWREWRSTRRGDGAYTYQYIRYEQD